MDYALALLSGALLALSFPKFGHPALAWIALSPLLLALAGSRSTPTRTVRLGLLTGGVYFAGTLYWIPRVMMTYGGLSRPVSVGIAALLTAYLALFPALFALAAARTCRALGPAGLLLTPAMWVTSELGRMYLLSGFPWELLGYSQTAVAPVAQLASVFGVHGVSALVVLVNASTVYAVTSTGRGRLAAIGATGLCVAAVTAWGAWRLGDGRLVTTRESVTVALLQGNIPQEQKWNPAFAGSILDRYVTMTREAAARGARFIIWPESATPFNFEDDERGGTLVREVARETGAYLLVGSDQVERGSPVRFYNAAFLVTPAGETGAVYRKIHLVPFGEYVPARRLLFFVSPLVETVADFAPGQEPVTLPVAGHLASTAICYEVIYPGLISRFVDRGSELLSTITNDAWYGRSSAPEQHFQQAAMRAIEQGRYLVRAANTGVSGIVDPYGRVVARSALFEQAMIVGDVAWLTGRTVYGRIGDAFALGCVAVTLASLFGARRRRAL